MVLRKRSSWRRTLGSHSGKPEMGLTSIRSDMDRPLLFWHATEGRKARQESDTTLVREVRRVTMVPTSSLSLSNVLLKARAGDARELDRLFAACRNYLCVLAETHV